MTQNRWIAYFVLVLLVLFQFFNLGYSPNKLAAELKNFFSKTYESMTKKLLETRQRYDLSNTNIVVSFSTTPYRVNKLQSVINDLLAQNVKINRIYLSIPYKFKRDNLDYDIPKWLLEHKKITILRTKDYGPATKLLGVLEKIKFPPNTIIITVDDDMHYPNNLVLNLAHKALEFPHDAIGTCGVNILYDENGQIKKSSEPIPTALKAHIEPDALVTILEGFAGIAYRPEFFDNSIFEDLKTSKECLNSDDIYISFYLAKHNIRRRNLINKYISVYDIKHNDELARAKDALHLIESTYLKKQKLYSAS